MNAVPLGNHPSTSTASWVVPPELKIETEPSAPTGTITMLGRVRPAAVFRFDAFGRVAPVGKMVRNPVAEGAMAVTLSATAPMPVLGTAPRPRTGSTRVSPLVNTPPACCRPSTVTPLPRVSSSRCGVAPVNPLPVGNQPSTSMTTSTVPAELNTLISPPVPSGTTTMFGRVRPAAVFRFDAVG
ncbi:MAG: hypothetical protein ABMA25_01285 [Ilumatobacteraceae bacterium]